MVADRGPRGRPRVGRPHVSSGRPRGRTTRGSRVDLVQAYRLFEVGLGNLCQSPPSARHGHHCGLRRHQRGNPARTWWRPPGWADATELQTMADATIRHALTVACLGPGPTALEAVWVNRSLGPGTSPPPRTLVRRWPALLHGPSGHHPSGPRSGQEPCGSGHWV